jgi:DNA-binding XRE family transcriptional regulator
MTVQIIKQDEQPEWAVIPYEIYLQLVENAEMLQDIQDYDSLKAAIQGGGEKLIPADVINAILDGENAIRVWRQYRGYSQATLATEAGISIPYLSQLESGKRKGSVEVLANIARALEVALETIIPPGD